MSKSNQPRKPRIAAPTAADHRLRALIRRARAALPADLFARFSVLLLRTCRVLRDGTDAEAAAALRRYERQLKAVTDEALRRRRAARGA